MARREFSVSVVTPDGPAYEGDAQMIIVPGADGEDTIGIRTCAYLSLSFDHRIVDGADADKFMAFVKKSLETFPEAVL